MHMKNLFCFFCFLSLNIALFAQKNKAKQVPTTPSVSPTNSETKIPLTADKWDIKGDKATFFEKNNIQYMLLKAGNQGAASPKDVSFTNGTIEFDFEPTAPMSLGSSPTVYFRGNTSSNDAEIFYIRARPNNPRANDAIQYCPILGGVNMWDMYTEYQAPALFEIGKSNHLKMVIHGEQMRVYVNDMSRPALQIPKLEGRGNGSSIAVDGGMLVSNFLLKPDVVENLPSIAAPDLTDHDANFIRNWAVTAPSNLEIGKEIYTANLPKAEIYTDNIVAEAKGMVNITKKYGGNMPRRVVYLKAKIKSESLQKVGMNLGFSDEVWVFLNNQMIYVDKNIYLQAPMRKYPEGRISLLNSKMTLPLKQGDNELVIAVANDFYGWGIIARLDSMEGVEFVKE